MIGNNTVRSFVHTVTAGDLAVGDLVKIKSLTRMEELNDKQCQLAEVNTENNVILREVIGTVNNDKVTVALDTSLYDKSESVGLSGILYKYFKEVKGLEHLVGQQVDYLSDGNRGTEKITVKEDGTVTLPQETTYAAVGFAYKSILYTVPLSGGSMIGSSVGAIGRQNDCVISLYKSLGGKIGESSNETHDILYRRSDGKIVDVPHKLYTGMIRQSLAPSGNILERQVYIEHEDPTSFNVLSITQDVTVSDGAQ